MSAPRELSFASARKASSKQDRASGNWFCSRCTSPVLKQTEAAAPRGTYYNKYSYVTIKLYKNYKWVTKGNLFSPVLDAQMLAGVVQKAFLH